MITTDTSSPVTDYTADLARRLPDLRQIEGFPLGDDRDILALSKPPFYTACPNPYIADFVREHGTPYDEATDTYHREPFVGDVSEGKNDPIYNAHSYHTKVPHKAIMQYIKHYTEPGDVVLDGFCGTGMTGVAAQLLGRKAILSDLSPIATFIAYNYNNPVDLDTFEREAKHILREVEEECGWMYETTHRYTEKARNPTTGSVEEITRESRGMINCVIWSDVFISPFSGEEFVFWDVAVDSEKAKVLDTFPCPHTGAMLSKDTCEKATLTFLDQATETEITITKQVPVLINYTVRLTVKGKDKNVRTNKRPDQDDLSLINKINSMRIPYWYPSDKMMFTGTNWGDTWRSGVHAGISNVHHFYTKRNLWTLACLQNLIYKKKDPSLMFIFTGIVNRSSQMNRIHINKYFNGGGGWNAGYLKGTLYVSSLPIETSIFEQYEDRLNSICRAYAVSHKMLGDEKIVSCNSTTALPIPTDSIDYVFTDPPFGENLMYSELSFIWESWLKVFTNNKLEAIMNQTQQKGLVEYGGLMVKAFKEYYRVLKPKRWITVEFHNSKSSVWNAIQEGMTKAGFIIAYVTVLDKKQGSHKQVMSAGAVANDLVISAYKPTRAFEERFLRQAGDGLELDFVMQFLVMEPVQPLLERTEKMLYSKMLAYYVQRGYEVQQDASTFYRMLRQNLYEEDGYWFTTGQINQYAEYKKQYRLAGNADIQSGALLLFVVDERSALAWLNSYLSQPRTFSDLYTAFTKVSNIAGDNVPDLRTLLDENFVEDGSFYRRPSTTDEHVASIERRERVLLREFEILLLRAQNEKGRIKQVRLEAVQKGFEYCIRQKRFADIITLAKKLEKGILETQSELRDFVELAEIHTEGF